jgi:hypothetical protein
MHCLFLVLKRIAITEREVFKRRIFFFFGDSISLGIVVVSPSILSKEETMKVWLDDLIGTPHMDKKSLTRLVGSAIHTQTLTQVILHPLDMMLSFVPL